MHRIFCSNIPQAGELFSPDAREAEHLFKVFRARPGDPVELLDGRGGRALSEVAGQRQIKTGELVQCAEPALKLHLCCAMPKRQKLDSMLKQAAELGAWTIRPVCCERSVAGGDPRERWDILLQEACKQSGNPFLPVIHREKKLQELLDELKQENVEIFYGSVKVIPLSCGGNSAAGGRAVLIGPEGGFSDQEIELIESYGARPLNLGPHILRLETAAIAALAVLRMLKIALIALLLPLSAGCEQKDLSRNPLMLKAEQLRSSGSFDDARRFLRQAIARYPEAPEAYLALAKLCDEELNDKLEALYCYRNYLQFASPDDPRREDIRKFAGHLQAAITAEAAAASADFAELQKKHAALQQELSLAKRLIISNQQKINSLQNQLKAARQRGRKR